MSDLAFAIEAARRNGASAVDDLSLNTVAHAPIRVRSVFAQHAVCSSFLRSGDNIGPEGRRWIIARIFVRLVG